MTIRKAIQWLEMYANKPVKWDDYSDGSKAIREEAERQIAESFKMAINALKAQEPKLVHVTANINHRKIGECPTCGKSINSGDYPNYCGRCGQAVKWE